VSAPPAISVRDIRVAYRPYRDRVPTLRRAIAHGRTKESQEVVALDRVSFDVAAGEAVAVIGGNGAGKSTLLRVVAGTLPPDAGEVRTHGHVSTLLQLGVGFNAEMPGRYNVMLSGLASGLTRAQVQERFDDIVDYAGVRDAIDRPVKTYSSGMFARLAFSVGMHLDPDVLLVDEVLAVGDQEFRDKSMASMRSLLSRSGTILFVTHSLRYVTELCDRAVWLEKGRVRMVGLADEVVGAYKNSGRAAS
jgi:ABC-type polysaccharide/polyol phosphate transport system ATPase subunit